MWARDEPPNPHDPTKNLYGVHAFYMCLEGDGNAHGVLMLNTHAQEVCALYRHVMHNDS